MCSPLLFKFKAIQKCRLLYLKVNLGYGSNGTALVHLTLGEKNECISL